MPGKGLRGRGLRWPPRRGTRVTCPAAPSAAPHRPAPHGLSAGDPSILPPGSLRARAALPAAKRPLRHPRISPASALVRIRCCRRSSRASNRSGLTSCRTRARVLVALLEGPPSPGQTRATKTGQMMCSLQSHFMKVDGREGLLYDDFDFVVAVVRRHRCIHYNGLRDRIATRSCRS